MATSTHEIRIPHDGGALLGDLSLAGTGHGLVLFVHGRGLGRHDAEGRTVARQLHKDGISTLAIDLLPSAELETSSRPDAALLTARVLHVVEWLGGSAAHAGEPLGLCGIGAGGVVALIAAARLGKGVQAVASIGGRPDTAGPAVLSTIKAPTLMLVGSRDRANLPRHDAAYQLLKGERSLGVVPEAGPQLEEPGVMAHAGQMAADWFEFHLLALEEVA